MRNKNYYYFNSISDFLLQSKEEILGIITKNDESQETIITQRNTWNEEIDILKNELNNMNEGYIIFEYTIPRIGKRIDTIIIYNNIIFILEFKCGESKYLKKDCDQVYDYALDLQNFHKDSHNKLLVPILIPTNAKICEDNIIEENRIIEPIKCNNKKIAYNINKISSIYNSEPSFDPNIWVNSSYNPSPTIIEAARALYNNHNVEAITRSDANAYNLSITTNTINKIIEESKRTNSKSICFVTGVPGAGKTLVGLNLSIERFNAEKGEHAVFLSGNYPLVTVLQEALARDKVQIEKNRNNKISKKDALSKISAFIQIIHKYRDYYIGNNTIPPEHVVIFDEAQRAWTKDEIKKFMKTKKEIPDFQYSEPEFLISTINRHTDWGVIVCLIGGGQEINTGEAGLPEWFDSLRRSFKDWNVYITTQLNDTEYIRNTNWEKMISNLKIHENESLHLKTSIRSFRTPDLASFIKELLDNNISAAKELYCKIKEKYPLFITRDLLKAKDWVRRKSKGTTRYGLITSSNIGRLKAEGIFVKDKINIANWFLNDKDDVRSSYFLEDVVTEFDIQGLEIDYSILAWDLDLRIDNGKWCFCNFSGNNWQKINKFEDQIYKKNAYRVLLTRARQGMVIFVPKGSLEDKTRPKQDYDAISLYFNEIGIEELT